MARTERESGKRKKEMAHLLVPEPTSRAAADGRRQRSREIIDEKIKTDPGQEQIFAEHLDGLERSDFCDFDKLRKRACQKAKIESNEQSKEGGRPK